MFRGTYTAIVTPFNEEGEIDWDTLEGLTKNQLSNGVSGIVACGTTGESPTLTESELEEVVGRVIDYSHGKGSVIAGTGTYSTAKSIALSRKAESLGADACLVVNPYYNKPTQEGLYRHFRAIAESVGIPIIIYNIKGRTAVNVETSTMMRLIESCPNITGVKEASGDLDQMKDVMRNRPGYFSVLSGDDNMTFDLIRAGGDGVISVASNLLPRDVSGMVNSALEGRFDYAKEQNDRLMPLFKGLFIETNPIPIKAALAMRGMCQEIYRLPMCELMPENHGKLVELVGRYF
jgi:4-hydroxy-tetrahydrodipicolinate synthase